MARGSVVNEPIVSQANTEEFEQGYARTFGDKPIQRGRWVWDAAQGKLVSAENYQPPPRAIDGTIMCDRYMEGAHTTDGVDIGSRQKRKRYMAEHGLADAGDYKNYWQQAPAKREAERRRDVSTDVENVVREMHQRRR